MDKKQIVIGLTVFKYTLIVLLFTTPFTLNRLDIEVSIYYLLIALISLIFVLKISSISNKILEINNLDIVTRIYQYVYYRKINKVIKEAQFKSKIKKVELIYAEIAYSLSEMKITDHKLELFLETNFIKSASIFVKNKSLYIYTMIGINVALLLIILYCSETNDLNSSMFSIGVVLFYYSISSLLCIASDNFFYKHKNEYIIKNTITMEKAIKQEIIVYNYESLKKFNVLVELSNLDIIKVQSKIKNYCLVTNLFKGGVNDGN